LSEPHAYQVAYLDRSAHSTQLTLAQLFDFGELFDRSSQPPGCENLSIGRLGTEPGCQVDDSAYRSIVEAILEADPAQRGISLGHADTKSKPVASALPVGHEGGDRVSHVDCHACPALRSVWTRQGIVEEYQHAVAREAIECTFVLADQRPDGSMVLRQHRHDVLRFRRLGKRRDSAQIAEHGDDFSTVVLQKLLIAGRDNSLGELRRQEAA